MGRRLRTTLIQPSLFFVTATVLNHEFVFDSDQGKALVVEKLLKTSVEQGVRMIGYVVMSTHVHSLCYCQDGGDQLSRFVHSVKGRIRKDLFGDLKLWEDRFDDEVVTTEQEFRNYLNYIHNNPVKAGLVDSPDDYKFSSAKIWSGSRIDDRVYTDLKHVFRD